MRISHGTRIKDVNDTNGYGYATVGMLSSLSRLGYEVNQNDPTADVEIWFDQPHHWDFSGGPYRIGYHPWESTRLKEGWVDIMNQCDEIWTPSPLIAKWYQEDGVNVPVYTYLHGVDKVWTPKRREIKDTFRFLHCGGEAARKGGSETMRAFRKAFGKNEDVSLTMKVIQPQFNIPSIGRAQILNKRLSLNELIDLYHSHHVYVYPSWGEGFGLTPIQAMSTGMPTITLPAWAPYANFLEPELSVGSRLVHSQWNRTHHPGQMFKPNFDEIVDRMRYAYDNYDEAHSRALARVDELQSTYDWDKLTQKTFSELEERLAK